MTLTAFSLYFTKKTAFYRISAIKGIFRDTLLSLGKGRHSGISPLSAVATALGGTVGVGSIVGVGYAIRFGGAGSIFWMWICAFLGMIIKCAEATLAVRYRIKDASGLYIGGPMHIISEGLGNKWAWLASCYCFFGVVASFGAGNATQINAMMCGINSVIQAYGGSDSPAVSLCVGLCSGILVFILLSGGAKSIGQEAERLVPFAAITYLLLGFGVLVVCYKNIPIAFSLIFQGAFTPGAVTGGAIGSVFIAIRTGASRGVFTNEAGMGTAAIAHAAAQVKHPVQQGLMGVIEVFIDTILICTMTALVILCSGVPIRYDIDSGVFLTTAAFSAVYGSWVCIPICLILVCFTFATVLGWGLYGGRCAQYLFGDHAWKTFTIIAAATVVLGAVLNTGTLWLFSEMVNGLMVIPNLIALGYLTSEFKKLILD